MKSFASQTPGLSHSHSPDSELDEATDSSSSPDPTGPAPGNHSEGPQGANAELSLREIKKRRTRVKLADAALDLFSRQGFAETTLDELVAAVGVSKRTFFRNFESKESVAIATELDLWKVLRSRVAYGIQHSTPPPATILQLLRDSFLDSLRVMPDGWEERFFTTHRFIVHHPAVRSAALREADRFHRDISKLGPYMGYRESDTELQLVIDMALSAWRAGANSWVSSRKIGYPSDQRNLYQHVVRAFELINQAHTLPMALPVGSASLQRKRADNVDIAIPKLRQKKTPYSSE